MMAEGVIMQAWVSHFVIAPPLIVEKEEIVRGIGMLDKWLRSGGRDVRGRLCSTDRFRDVG